MNDDFKKQIAEATPEQQKAILQQLSGTEVGQSYASSIAQSYWNENIKSHDKKFYDGIDAKFNELGFEKQDGQKTSEFLVQIAAKNKELAEKLEAVSQDPDKSKKALQDLIEKNKKEIEQITNNYNKAIQEKDGIINELNQKQVSSLKSSTINQGIAKLNFSKGFSDEMINDILKLKKQELISHSRVENDKIVWCDEQGIPIKGPNGVTHATLEEVLTSKFKAYLETSSPGGGAGKTTDFGASGFTGKEIHIDITNVKTRMDFLTYFDKVASANGISKEDDNYNNLYIDAKARYNIDALPEY